VSINSFSPRKFEDFTIVDENGHRVGHIRVKPSGVLWAPKNSKRWLRVPLEDFATFMENNGKLQKK
jgi:hypothetical protein